MSPLWIFGPPVFLGWLFLLSYFIRKPRNRAPVWISVVLVKDVHRARLHSSGSSSSWVGKGSPRRVFSWPLQPFPTQRGHKIEYVQRKQMHCLYTNNSAILTDEHSQLTSLGTLGSVLLSYLCFVCPFPGLLAGPAG